MRFFCWWCWFLIFRVCVCELKCREHNLVLFFFLLEEKTPQNIIALNLHLPFHTVTECLNECQLLKSRFTLPLNSYKFKYRNRVEVTELISRNILVLTECPEKQEYYHCFCKIPHPKHYLELTASQTNLSYGTAIWFLYTSTLLALRTHHCDFCLDFFFMNIFHVEILRYTWGVSEWVSELCRKWSVQVHGMVFRQFNFHL